MNSKQQCCNHRLNPSSMCALAETVNGLYKTELIYQRRSWDSLADVELATMHWVYWWNNKRYHDALGLKTPAQVEAAYYANRPELVQV
ncbi:transposase [Corynebacterium diphtheriae]|nr:transposase [Corynebacterium diphtheriae]